MAQRSVKASRKRSAKKPKGKKASSSLSTRLAHFLALPFHAVDHWTTSPFETAQDTANITATSLLQTHKAVVQRILWFCISGPVIVPPCPFDPRRHLMQTCKLWRDIVVSTPEYWSNIIFSPGPFRSVLKLNLLSRMVLHRSGERPLDFDLVGSIQGLVANPAASRSAEDLIFGQGQIAIMRTIVHPNRRRIKSLKLIVCTHEDFLALKDIKGSQYPQLEELDIAIPPSLVPKFAASFGFDRKLDIGLDTFPYIHRLSLHILGMTVFHPLKMVRLPWSQITDLSFAITFIRPDVFAGIMRCAAPSLVKATFCVAFARASHRRVRPNLGHGFVYMPALSDLNLTLHNVSEDTRVFKIMQLPVLKCLLIRVTDEYTKTCDMSMFMKMIGTVHALEQLRITHTWPKLRYPPYVPLSTRVPMAAEVVASFFRGLKNVRILCLPRGMLLPFLVLDMLAQGELLPSLIRIDLTATGKSWEQVLAMVQGRNEMVRRCHLELLGGSSPHPLESQLHPCRLLCAHMSIPQSAYSRNIDDIVKGVNSLCGLVTLDTMLNDLRTYFI